jgi:hypothetical protein
MKTTVTILSIILILCTITMFFTGCDVNLAGATLSEAVMCTGVDPETLSPKGKTDVFPPDFEELNCNARLSNAPAGTLVKAQFMDSSNTLITESTVEVKGTEYVNFRMARGEKPWVAGDYSVILYLDGKKNTTVNYKIQGEVIEAVTEFSEVAICQNIDLDTLKPLDTTAVFPPDFITIYISARINNAASNTEIAIKWFNPDGILITENSVKVSGTQYVAFALDRADAVWPEGSYSAILLINNVGDYVIPFIIK